MPVTTEPTGVFITHDPVRSPCHNVCLALHDSAQTPRARIVFDRPPGWNLPDMPAPIKRILVGVIRIEDAPRHISRSRGRRLSAAFGILGTSMLLLASHNSIVTYSPLSHRNEETRKHPLDYVPICDLSLPNVLLPMPAASMRSCRRPNASS